MWPLSIVVLPPLLDELPGMAHRHEPMLVQAFISELAVEALDITILLRFAGLNEAQLQPHSVSPFIQRLADEFRAVINRDAFGQATALCQPLQYIDDPLAGQ